MNFDFLQYNLYPQYDNSLVLKVENFDVLIAFVPLKDTNDKLTAYFIDNTLSFYYSSWSNDNKIENIILI